MEGSARANVLKLSYNKSMSFKFLHRAKYLGECMYVDCDITAHVYQLLEVKIGDFPGFKELMCL